MDPNKAVQYQNPAHVHDGTSAAAFTVASGLADTTRLAPTGIERMGTSADLPLDLAAKGKGAVHALGGPLVVGLCNTAFGGFLPRPYTAVPGSDRLLLAGGDYSSEFTSDEVYYTDGELYHFMDTETYEQPSLSKEILGEAIPYLKEGTTLELQLYEGEPLDIELPITVDLAVAEAPPGYAGDTATGASKEVVLETGMRLQVPLFINTGDRIRVDTRSGEYMERCK